MRAYCSNNQGGFLIPFIYKESGMFVVEFLYQGKYESLLEPSHLGAYQKIYAESIEGVANSFVDSLPPDKNCLETLRIWHWRPAFSEAITPESWDAFTDEECKQYIKAFHAAILL